MGAGLYMYDVVGKKFTFAIISPDEFLYLMFCISMALKRTVFEHDMGETDRGTDG